VPITNLPTVKTPSKCSSVEREDFATLVLAGGEVAAELLVERIEAAHALLFLREISCLVGIAALKNPNANYRASVFEKAGVTQSHEEYPLELGWVFVLPIARGKGYSKTLVKAAVEHAGSTKIFATSRSDNVYMHSPLLETSFIKYGNDYASQRGAHHLSLFLRQVPAI